MPKFSPRKTPAISKGSGISRRDYELSLDLNFAATRTLDPRITFTRASTGTFIGSDGLVQSASTNTPRFTHDPVTGRSLGLLIEESRTNLLLRSEEFDTASWTAQGVGVTANATASPAGSATADLVYALAQVGAFKELQQNASVVSGTTYTYSIYAKASALRYIQIIGNGTVFGTFSVNYDLQTAAEISFSAGTSTVVARTIQALSNGWCRIAVSVTALSTSTSGRITFNLIPASNSARGVDWTGDGTSGIFVWGAQLEAGAFATSYIPTTSASATRAADVATIPTAQWYNPLEGTFVVEFRPGALGSYQQIIHVDNGTDINERGPSLAVGTDNLGRVDWFVGGVSQVVNQRSGTVSLTAQNIAAVSYRLGEGIYNSANNAAFASLLVALTAPAVSTLTIGLRPGGNNLNGPIARIRYWRRAVRGRVQALSAR